MPEPASMFFGESARRCGTGYFPLARAQYQEVCDLSFEQLAFMQNDLGMSNREILEALGERVTNDPGNTAVAMRIAAYWLRECWIKQPKLTEKAHG